ncbi:MAG: hypothetical protein WBO46_03120 [Caldilineaceae bacterium]
MSRRNNSVFLVGTPASLSERTVHTQAGELLVLDLYLRTDKPEITGLHRVVVRGPQAQEVKYFLKAAEPEMPDLYVLGWLRSGGKESVVIAERVTVLTNRHVRQTAVEAIRNDTDFVPD